MSAVPVIQQSERRLRIVSRLRESSRPLTTRAIHQREWEVSYNAIGTDLRELEEQGLVRRVSGAGRTQRQWEAT